MAGHSKFKNIMHRKGAQDKKRAAMFSKLSREITVAAKMGMPDPDMNPRLRLAVNAAKAQSMPKDNIQRAIDKASQAGGEDYIEMRYEGYGPGGVALIVEALTDNRNRTATNVRTAFSKNGGNLGSEGSVSHGFERRGLIEYSTAAGDEEKVLEAAIEAGADDVESSEDGHTIWTAADALHGVAGELEKVLGPADNVKLAWKPVLTVEADEATAATLMKLIDTLEDDDDVQTVWGNYEISDEVMEKLGVIWQVIAKALLAGAMIAAIGEIGRRLPGAAALVASLPLVSVLGMVFLWWNRPDTENMARHAEATFWYVLPSLPMFLAIPVMLRAGINFWIALALGCALTVGLYLAMTGLGPRFGLRL